MLRQVLDLIATGEALSTGDLEQRLGASSGVVSHMLEQLVALGYLRPEPGCSGACQKCPLAGGCPGLPKMWVLTEKGRQGCSQHARP